MSTRATRARVSISVLFCLHGLIVSTWLSRIPAVQSALHLNEGQLGFALLGTAIGALISMPVTGVLVSRCGSRLIAIVSTFFMASSLMLLPLASTSRVLTIFLAIFGVFSGAMNVSMNAQAVVLEKRGNAAIMSSFHALFSLGGMAGASLGSVLAGFQVPPRQQFVFAAPLFATIALFAGPALLRDDKGIPGTPVFARPTRALLGLGCLAFCILLNEGAMADWSSVYLRRSLHSSESIAALGYATFSCAMAGGRLFGDFLTERVGRVAIVRWGGTIAGLGLATGLLVGNVPATLLSFFAAGVGFSIIVPLTFVAAGRNQASAGLGLAAVNTAGYLGFLSGPPSIGLTANTIGLQHALFIVVGLSFFVASLARTVDIPANTFVIRTQEPVLQ